MYSINKIQKNTKNSISLMLIIRNATMGSFYYNKENEE